MNKRPKSSGQRLGTDSGGAGASALREYKRRCVQRDARARARLGPVGLAVARLLGDPQSTRAWKQGAEQEIRVAARLGKHLDRCGVVLLHDRRIPGRGRANIDHIAIGAGGVSVIDTKSARGRLQIKTAGGRLGARRELLLINGRDRTELVDALECQIAVVRQALAGLRAGDVSVRGALCFPNIDGLPVLRPLRMHSGGSRSTGRAASRSSQGAPARSRARSWTRSRSRLRGASRPRERGVATSAATIRSAHALRRAQHDQSGVLEEHLRPWPVGLQQL
jgi:hypothetical protein